MKKLIVYLALIFVSCSTTKHVKKNCQSLNCYVIDIEEYQHFILLKTLRERDTIRIISFKKSYNKKIIFNKLEEIKLDKYYNFCLTQKKANVSTMEQLGAFIVVENDTIWTASTYKDIPLFFISHNTIGKFHEIKQ